MLEEHGGFGAKFLYNSLNKKFYRLEIAICQDLKQLFTNSQLGGSIMKHKYPCSLCACPNGQFSAPAPYRCAWCLKLDNDLRIASAKLPLQRTVHENKLLEACSNRSLKCHHFDFLHSEARKFWEEIRDSKDFEETIKVLFLTANSQDVHEVRKLAENLGIDEAKEATKLNRGSNSRSKLNKQQLLTWIKEWRDSNEIGYKNIDDDDISEARINAVWCTSLWINFLNNIFFIFINPVCCIYLVLASPKVRS